MAGATRRGMGSDGRGVGKMEIFWILSDLRKEIKLPLSGEVGRIA